MEHSGARLWRVLRQALAYTVLQSARDAVQSRRVEIASADFIAHEGDQKPRELTFAAAAEQMKEAL